MSTLIITRYLVTFRSQLDSRFISNASGTVGGTQKIHNLEGITLLYESPAAVDRARLTYYNNLALHT